MVVVAVLAVDDVVSGAGVERVVARLAVKDIVALVTVDRSRRDRERTSLPCSPRSVSSPPSPWRVSWVGVAREVVVAALALDGVVTRPSR